MDKKRRRSAALHGPCRRTYTTFFTHNIQESIVAKTLLSKDSRMSVQRSVGR